MIINSERNSLQLCNCTYEKVGIGKQQCTGCGLFKSTKEFYGQSKAKSGFRSKCIECTGKVNKKSHIRKKLRKAHRG